MNISIIGLLALGIISSGFFINDAFAEVGENSAYLIEGSGFAVTEDIIRLSEIDIGLSSHQQTGSSIDFVIEDGFVTLDNEDFVISELEGKFLREGRYIRINGNVESSVGFDTTISFFGRLVAESKDASVYGFTGRITTPDNSYKIIYTAKLSQLTNIVEITETGSSLRRRRRWCCPCRRPSGSGRPIRRRRRHRASRRGWRGRTRRLSAADGCRTP